MVIRKMQTTDYTSVSSEFATYRAIKSLWIKETLTKVLSTVSVEIIKLEKHEGLLHSRNFISPLKAINFFLKA